MAATVEEGDYAVRDSSGIAALDALWIAVVRQAAWDYRHGTAAQKRAARQWFAGTRIGERLEQEQQEQYERRRRGGDDA